MFHLMFGELITLTGGIRKINTRTWMLWSITMCTWKELTNWYQHGWEE